MNGMNDRSERGEETKRRLVKFGLPIAVAVGVAASVPFILGSGGDSISTTDASTTTVSAASTATTVVTSDDVFTSADVTTEDIAVTTVATTSTTIAPTTTAPATTVPETLPEQPPEPIAPPADPRAPEDQIQLGGISIPKLDVNEPLLEGIRLTTLDNGPGHWPGTAMPGEVGNVVVAAHRTSHGGPFRNIDQLVAGDSVMFNTSAGEAEYLVTSTEIVEPDAIWIVDPTDTPTATLFACHPPGSVAQRIVVHLELA